MVGSGPSGDDLHQLPGQIINPGLKREWGGGSGPENRGCLIGFEDVGLGAEYSGGRASLNGNLPDLGLIARPVAGMELNISA